MNSLRGAYHEGMLDAKIQRRPNAHVWRGLRSAVHFVFGRLAQVMLRGRFARLRPKQTVKHLPWDTSIPTFLWTKSDGFSANGAFHTLFGYEPHDSPTERIELLLAPHLSDALNTPAMQRQRVYVLDRTIELVLHHKDPQTLIGIGMDVTDLLQSRDEAEATCLDLKTKCFLLRKHMSDLEEHLECMVRGFVNVVEAKDPYTAGHSDRVMQYAVRIGQAIGLTCRELKVLALGALVHDVGKIGIPDAVLMKPGRLTAEEFQVIQTHTEIGARVMRGIPFFEECMPIIEMHHERLNGEGYPAGVSGDEIPLLVRIATVADVFDALTSTRAYSKALTVEAALEILENDADAGILDGKIVTVLADIVRRDGALWSDELDEAA